MKRLFVISFLTWSIFAQIALAAESGGVGGKPANPDPLIPHARQWFIYTLHPGEKKEDELLVQNSANEPVDVLLYSADYSPSTDGAFALEQMVEPKDFVGKWITLSQTKLHLEPQESKIVPFTIEVPDNPTLDVGEHAGGILIEKIKQEQTTTGGLQLLTRVGVRVYVTIPGEIIKKLEIENFELELNKEKTLYTTIMKVKNSGNVSQDITVNITIANAYQWLRRVFKQFPLENSRDLQVLRDSTLTSGFEFPKPWWGMLRIEGNVVYENQTKILSAQPIIRTVPIDQNVAILFIAGCIFIISIITLFTVKKHVAKKKRR